VLGAVVGMVVLVLVGEVVGVGVGEVVVGAAIPLGMAAVVCSVAVLDAVVVVANRESPEPQPIRVASAAATSSGARPRRCRINPPA